MTNPLFNFRVIAAPDYMKPGHSLSWRTRSWREAMMRAEHAARMSPVGIARVVDLRRPDGSDPVAYFCGGWTVVADPEFQAAP